MIARVICETQLYTAATKPLVMLKSACKLVIYLWKSNKKEQHWYFAWELNVLNIISAAWSLAMLLGKYMSPWNLISSFWIWSIVAWVTLAWTEWDNAGRLIAWGLSMKDPNQHSFCSPLVEVWGSWVIFSLLWDWIVLAFCFLVFWKVRDTYQSSLQRKPCQHLETLKGYGQKSSQTFKLSF